jgi:hypothetical protein
MPALCRALKHCLAKRGAEAFGGGMGMNDQKPHL